MNPHIETYLKSAIHNPLKNSEDIDHNLDKYLFEFSQREWDDNIYELLKKIAHEDQQSPIPPPPPKAPQQ